jgi:exonuclease SbcD
MKILHTADWHLGKKLEQSERTEEHQDFLDWLIVKLSDEQIDVLIIAGDIFDTSSPSNTALEQYYHFLSKVKNTNCKEVIIIGGNHDSISTLNAPQQLLKHFNIHVIGGVPDEFDKQIIEIRDKNQNLELVVCAVPFLRDKDIRLSVAGETAIEREQRIKQGIVNHYHNFKEYILDYKKEGIPVFATGHLFAAGAETSESEKEIHVGNLGQIGGEMFPIEFDYVALGHIHRPQLVNKMSHIRYSGSPIALSFSETDDQKQVLILHIEDRKLKNIEELKVPTYRKLLRIKGDLETVKSKLLLLEDPKLKYPAWVELQINTETFIHDLQEQLEYIRFQQPFIERFFPRQIRSRAIKNLAEQTEELTILNDLTPKDVFLKKCSIEFPENDSEELLNTFEEIMEIMIQKEN